MLYAWKSLPSLNWQPRAYFCSVIWQDVGTLPKLENLEGKWLEDSPTSTALCLHVTYTYTYVFTLCALSQLWPVTSLDVSGQTFAGASGVLVLIGATALLAICMLRSCSLLELFGNGLPRAEQAKHNVSITQKDNSLLITDKWHRTRLGRSCTYAWK